MRRDRIATVLRVRSVQERQAQAAAARAAADEVAADAALAGRRDRDSRRPRPRGELSPLQLRSLQLMGVRSRELIEEAAAVASRAAEHRDAIDAEATRASVRRRSAERLHERRREAAVHAAAAAAERALDELVTLRWRRAP